MNLHVKIRTQKSTFEGNYSLISHCVLRVNKSLIVSGYKNDSIELVSEHSLFKKEQFGMLESCTNNTYNSLAATISDNPPVLLGKLAQGNVALLRDRIA